MAKHGSTSSWARVAAAALMLAATTAGCNLLGPTESFDGEWTALGPGHGGYFIGLSLRQTGDAVSGAACAYESGVKLYSNAPVTGTHPTVRVVVTPEAANPCCPWLIGQTFTGEMERRGEIVVSASGLRFTRSTTPACP